MAEKITHEPDSKSATITRDDLVAKFNELSGGVEDRADEARNTLVSVAVAVGAVVVVAAFLLGRSRGRSKSTVIEVRRY